MKCLIVLLGFFSFSCFSVELYDCSYSEGDKITGKFRGYGGGAILVDNNTFLSHDSIHTEYQSPVLDRDMGEILLGENNDFVFALAKDKTNYAVVSKTDNKAYQWDKCVLDSVIDLKKLSYGEKQKNYSNLIKEYFKEILKDPDSAKYSDFSKPKKEFMLYKKEAIGGYSVCVNVNSKNSYGGYTGKQLYWLFFKDNKILRSQNSDSIMITRWHNINCDY